MTGVNKNKRLAVIILNWNGIALLKEFIPVALKYTSGEEVDLIVADNGSGDDSVKWLKENYPAVKIIELGKNYGFAGGYNRAITQIDYPYTLLLNSDVEVTSGWWQPLLEFMEAHPEVSAVQPKIKAYKNREYFEYAGAEGGYLDKLGYTSCLGRLFDRIEKDSGQYDGGAADICWASGAALMVRTSVYKKVGGLDPLFFAHMEEIDLCCRMLSEGYRVCVVPTSEVFHVGGASLAQGNPKKTYLNFRNNLLLLYKNLPDSSRSRILFLRRLADTLAFFMFVAKLDFANAGAVLKAHIDYRKMKTNYKDLLRNKRNVIFPGSDRSALIDRYLRKKK